MKPRHAILTVFLTVLACIGGQVLARWVDVRAEVQECTRLHIDEVDWSRVTMSTTGEVVPR